MLILNDISIRMAGRLLIDHASVTLNEGSKTGFVGHNGTGKSTLLRAIIGELPLESGEISLPKGTRIGQVAQEAPAGTSNLLDIVLAADKERTALLEEAELTDNPLRIAEIHSRLNDIDAHAAPARAASILAGLGFNAAAQLRPASSFSGGWRMRVALAAVLFSAPSLLLLDEPTNYLDLEGTLWLTDYIRRYPHNVIIISHDRELLNNTATSILHLENKKLRLWTGNYDEFAKQRAETIHLQQKQAAKQQAHKAHLEAFINRFRAQANKARQAQSRIKVLEKMQDVTVWQEDHVAPFSFPHAKKAVASPIIALSQTNVGYEPGSPILRNLDLRIDHDDRIALLGSNGNGKSTLAKLLAGRLSPETGRLVTAPQLKIAFFAQHQLDDLHPHESPIDHVRRLMPNQPEAKIRARTAFMGLTTEKMHTKAQDLSGGERARLLMGLATFNGPHLLILDEPTNHLDIESRTELINALNNFNGAVILIAHDRHLIEATMDRLWLVQNGTVTPYIGDMDDYRRDILGLKKNKKPEEKSEAQGVKKNDQRKMNAYKRASLAPLRQEITQAEALIQRLESLIARLDSELAVGTLYTQNPALAAQKSIERADAIKRLNEAETRWLSLSERYEEGTQ
ncbi:ABC-F family ATP-binding cassette domain-containing protein [Bartonella sp. DGB2]|uniref:ABC-F family ATP-binding cassette domain-containing protein n=1 Tax=Bartonella sp. DGB2 TaxID=3388426 RepID=UPI00398FD2D2